MLTMEFDYEKLADALAPRLEGMVLKAIGNRPAVKELKPLLTRQELMELFHIGDTKASELMKRPDFPVMREAGVLIPTKRLLQWIDRNTRWVEDNTDYFKVG